MEDTGQFGWKMWLLFSLLVMTIIGGFALSNRRIDDKSGTQAVEK